MTHPKTDPNIKKTKSTSTPAPARRDRASAAEPESQTPASAKAVEASDRLCQKLDELAGLFRQQIETWRPMRPPPVVAPDSRPEHGRPLADAPGTRAAGAGNEAAGAMTPPPLAPEGTVNHQQQQRRNFAATLPANSTPPEGPAPLGGPEGAVDNKNEQPPGAAATLPSAPTPPAGSAATAEGARSLVDRISQSDAAWREQAAGLPQALEAIMAHLENQAATLPPPVDVEGILSRLKSLEEQQQNLQSQFNTNR